MSRLSRLRAKAGAHEELAKALGAEPFVGTGQVAEILGIVKTNVTREREAGNIPEPFQQLPGGPIWLRSRIEAIAEERAQAKAKA